MGTFNLLDSIRKYSPQSSVVYSSSNKVYGDFNNLTFIEKNTRYECIDFPNGFDEKLPLDFHSPYGCSKGAADQYLLDFNRIYGIKTIVFRHSSMYGGNQHSTIDQGWIGWFCEQALATKNCKLNSPFTISGSGKQVRDVIHADDITRLYFSAVQNIDKLSGQAFNIGGGIENSLSLIELFNFLECELNVKLEYIKHSPRLSDQLVFVADMDKINKLVNWCPKIDYKEGIRTMLQWLESNNK
jgi:CDP-paratose 2-epimerase